MLCARALPLLLVLFAACHQKPKASAPSHYTDIAHFNLTQKTCALYVAVHSGALGHVGFGRDIDDEMVRWNLCPGGTMVACVKAPTPSGDSVITGIPWPH